MIAELYKARKRRHNATPGSREWWRATRDIRAARKTLRDVCSSIVESIVSFAQSLARSFGPLRELGKVLKDE
jgi:hypothetical protein